MEVSGQLHALAAFLPGEAAPHTHCIRGCVGSRVDLNFTGKRKILFPLRELNLDPSVIQRVALIQKYLMTLRL
jgi:hypothetical protein